MPVSRPHRRHRPLRTFALAMLASGLVGGIGGAIVGMTGDIGLPGPLIVGAAMAAGLVTILAVSVWWWRQIDEAAREAHKWAWWWGGSGGMGLGMLLLALAVHGLDNGWLDADFLGRDPVDILYRGVSAMLICQVAGYTLAWAAWWLRHR